MADYAKKTVAELQEILKSRGLTSSGKKAELIARLNENDKEVEAQAAAPAAEPELEQAPEEEEEPSTTAPSAASQPIPPTQEPTTDPTSTAATEPAKQPSPDTALAAQTNYSLNLPTSTIDTELAKRKARAERFGTGATTSAPAAEPTNGDASAPAEDGTTSDAQALKNLERAKRFGTGQTAIGKLDEALPSDAARGSRKRGHAAVAEATELDDPGLKRSFMSRGRGRGGRGRGGSGAGAGGGGHRGNRTAGGAPGARPQGVQKSGAPPAYTSDKDRLAAEARKKKFMTA